MPRRYWLIVGTFLLSMLLYVDRVCISVAKAPLASDLNFDDRQMGWVFAAFSLGYALFQTPAGWAVDRLGPRRVLTLVVTSWSLFTALTAAAWNLSVMLLVRFAFGVGEAGAFPGMARAFLAWLPLSERGRAHGINFSASRLGAAAALPAISALVTGFGWRATFVMLGAIGIVWSVGWFWLFRDDPAADPRLPEQEREFIMRQRQPLDSSASTLPVSVLCGSRNMWLAMTQYFASNFTFFFALTWLLPHLDDTFQLTTFTAGWLGALPLLAGMVGNWVGGAMVDSLFQSGQWGASRRVTAMCGFLVSAVGLTILIFAGSLTSTMSGLVLAVFGADMTLSPSWSFCSDIGREHAGVVSGTMNMAGNIGALLTSLAFPYLHSWSGSVVPFFATAASLNILAMVAWMFARPEHYIGAPLADRFEAGN